MEIRRLRWGRQCRRSADVTRTLIIGRRFSWWGNTCKKKSTCPISKRDVPYPLYQSDTSAEFHMKHYGIEQWADFTRGLSDLSDHDQMTAHLGSGCESCGRLAEFTEKLHATCSSLAVQQ